MSRIKKQNKKAILSTAIIFILAFTFLTTPAFSTAQAPDIILINGEPHALYKNPLESYLREKWRRPAYLKPHYTSNMRGYVATWEISENKLYLTKVMIYRAGWLCRIKCFFGQTDCYPDRENYNALGKIFRVKNKSKVLADWYSGSLRIPTGKQLQYVHEGYQSRYEKDLIFKVRNGIIIGQYTIGN